jgi:phosphoglycerate dehydrogenase-like enzyme
MENVTLLPHLGTAALEVREAMGRMAMENVIAFAEGRIAEPGVTGMVGENAHPTGLQVCSAGSTRFRNRV